MNERLGDLVTAAFVSLHPLDELLTYYTYKESKDMKENTTDAFIELCKAKNPFSWFELLI